MITMPFTDVRGTVETPGVAVPAGQPGSWVFGTRVQDGTETIVWTINTDGTIELSGTLTVDDLAVTDTLTAGSTELADLTVTGAVSLEDSLTVVGNATVADAAPATKAYRFRTSGSELDVDFGGTSANFSTFANADFTGTQRFYLALDSTQNLARAVRRWNWTATDPFGTVIAFIDPANNAASFPDLSITPAGRGLKIAEGANAKMGTATLVAGAATVATTAVAATSRILLTSQVDGGTPGFLRVSARVAGTSFTITSSAGADTSTVAWVILDPA